MEQRPSWNGRSPLSKFLSICVTRRCITYRVHKSWLLSHYPEPVESSLRHATVFDCDSFIHTNLPFTYLFLRTDQQCVPFLFLPSAPDIPSFSLNCRPSILRMVQIIKQFTTCRTQFLRSSMCALSSLWEARLHTRTKRVQFRLQYNYINQRFMVFSYLVGFTLLACAVWLLVFLFCQQRNRYWPHVCFWSVKRKDACSMSQPRSEFAIKLAVF
jgi:hypothetical protein